MESRVDETIARHKRGYNCAQAVACTYCDLFDVDEATMYRMVEGFGRGLGGAHDGACGAVTGACAVLSLAGSKWAEEKGKTKQGTYAAVKALCSAFGEKNGSILCEDLLGLRAAGVHHSCQNCILDAATLLEEALMKQAEQDA